jgi:hypothetical protein
VKNEISIEDYHASQGSARDDGFSMKGNRGSPRALVLAMTINEVPLVRFVQRRRAAIWKDRHCEEGTDEAIFQFYLKGRLPRHKDRLVSLLVQLVALVRRKELEE